MNEKQIKTRIAKLEAKLKQAARPAGGVNITKLIRSVLATNGFNVNSNVWADKRANGTRYKIQLATSGGRAARVLARDMNEYADGLPDSPLKKDLLALAIRVGAAIKTAANATKVMGKVREALIAAGVEVLNCTVGPRNDKHLGDPRDGGPLMLKILVNRGE